jgi:peptidoglycan/LPS O-acetylase OafA/YrhL
MARSAATVMGGGVQRLVALDGLRAVAAASIVVYHCWLFSSPAQFTWNLGPVTAFMQPLQAGVILFFVLSGFLLYLPVARNLMLGSPRPSTRRYLRNRALRILPAYWLILAISGFVLRTTVVSADSGLLTGSPGARLLTEDATLVANLHPSGFETGILPAWTLSIEVAFYLTLPLLALAAYALARARPTRAAWAALLPAALLVGVGLLVDGAGALLMTDYGRTVSPSWAMVLRLSFPAHADVFAYGMVAAVACVCVERGAPRIRRLLSRAATGRVLAYVGLPTWVLAFYALPRYAYDSILGVLLAVAIARLVVRTAEPQRKRRLLERRALVACGLGSYSAFLWNYPLLTFLEQKGILAAPGGAIAVLQNLALIGTLTAVASLLTYRLVEAPALALARPSSVPTRSAPVPVTVEPA